MKMINMFRLWGWKEDSKVIVPVSPTVVALFLTRVAKLLRFQRQNSCMDTTTMHVTQCKVFSWLWSQQIFLYMTLHI